MPPVDEPHIAALDSLAAALLELQISAVIIGGVAVSLIAHPRFTRDVDALIMFDTSEIEVLILALKRHEFEPLFPDMAAVAISNRVAAVRHVPTGITVDIALGCMPFEQEVIDRAIVSTDPEIRLPLPTPEDIVILKSIASRPKDIEDIRNISIVYPKMDRARIEYWVREYGDLLDVPDLWDRILPLLDG